MESGQEANTIGKLFSIVEYFTCNADTLKQISEIVRSGIDFNHKSKKCNQNTLLHVAVLKNDPVWVKILLELGIDTRKCNQDDQTAFDLALKSGNAVIIDLLREQPIRESFVHAYDENILNTKLSDSSFRILKVSHCSTIDEAFAFLYDVEIQESFKEAHYLFIIIISLERDFGNISPEKISQTDCISYEKPMVIAFESVQLKKSQIFYKDSNENIFKLVDRNVSISEDQSWIENKGTFSFANLCHQLGSNGSLLNFKLNTFLKFRNSSLLSYASLHQNILCLRFLRLFNWSREPDKSIESSLMTIIQFGGKQELKAFIDLPFGSQQNIHLSNEILKLIEMRDARNYNLLMLATECNNVDIVQYLINLSLFDVNEQSEANGVTAADIASQKEFCEIFIELLKGDSLFPDSTNINKFYVNNDFRRVLTTRNYLHDDIVKKSLSEIAKFIKENRQIKYAFNTQNKSALMNSLQEEAFEAYAFLRANGFRFGYSEHYEMELEKLEKMPEKKILLREANNKFFKHPDNIHIMKLVSFSKLAAHSNNQAELFKKITEYFEELDTIDEISTILKIVANAKNASFIFDFEQDSVHHVDPVCGNSDRGISYHLLNRIYIASKCEKREVLGTLAHELTHLALYLVFENNCEPFYKSDSVRATALSNITFNYGNNPNIRNRELIVHLAFNYRQEIRGLELIVRVPHLLAFYNGDSKKISTVSDNFYELFEYYRGTLEILKSEISIVQPKREIRELNELLGIKRLIKNLNLIGKYPLVSKDTCLAVDKVIVIKSETPQLILKNLFQILTPHFKEQFDTSFIFIDINQFVDFKYAETLQHLYSSERKPTICCINNSDIFNFVDGKFQKIINLLKPSSRLIFIDIPFGEIGETLRRTCLIEDIECIDITVEWNYLELWSQQEFLKETFINFQGEKIALNQILTPNSHALNNITLHSILNLHAKPIGLCDVKQLSLFQTNFFIERQFIKRISKVRKLKETDLFEDHFEDVIVKMENIIEQAESQKSVIIADGSGQGKSTVLLHISRYLKKKHPNNWIALVDLKTRADCYLPDGVEGNFSVDFIGRNILLIKNEVELMIFHQMFYDGKVILLFDGYDEISPKYKMFVRDMIKFILSSSYNQTWVTTRLHLAKTLEDALKQTFFKLSPFTRQDQIEFLKNYWRSKQEYDEPCLQDRAEKLQEAMAKKISSRNIIEIPMQLRMLAEIYDSENVDVDGMNFFKLYDAFVYKLIETWTEKGPLAKDEYIRTQTVYTINTLQVHYVTAMEYIFGSDRMKTLKLSPIEGPWNEEMISRIGIFQKLETGEFRFVHESFAEYFVANCINSLLFNRKLTTVSPQALADIFLDILITEKCEVIRMFLNELLTDTYIEQILNDRDLSENLYEAIKTRREFSMLSIATKEFNFGLMNFIHKLILQHADLANDILFYVDVSKSSDEGENTFLHHAAMNDSNIDIFQNAWSIARSVLVFDKEQLVRLFQKFNKNSKNVLKCAVAKGNSKLVEIIIEIAKGFLTPQEFKHLFIESKNDGTLFLVSMSSANYNIVSFLWNVIENNLSVDEQRKLLLEKGINKVNILCLAMRNVKISNEMISIVERVLTLDQLKILLGDLKVREETPIHTAASTGNIVAFQRLATTYERIFENAEDLKKILSKMVSMERNILHDFALVPNHEISTYLMPFLTKYVMNHCKSLFNERDALLYTPFQLAVQYGKYENIIDLWDFLEQFLSKPEKKTLLLERHCSFVNIIAQATSNADSKVLEFLSCIIFKYLGSEDIKLLLSDKNMAKCMFDKCSNVDSIIKFSQTFMTLLSNEQQSNFLCSSRLVLTNILLKKNKDISDAWMEILSDTLDEEQMKKLILESDQNGSTLFTFIVTYCDHEYIKSVFSFIKLSVNSNTADQKLILRKKGEQNQNSLSQTATRNNLKRTFETVLNIYLDVFDESEMKEIWFEQNANGITVLDIVLRNQGFDEFKILWSVIERTINSNELGQLLTLIGTSYINQAAVNLQNDLNVLKAFLKAIKDIDIEILKKMLVMRFRNGDTILHRLADYKERETVDIIWNLITTTLNPIEFMEMYTLIGFNDRTALLNAVIDKNRHVLKLLLNHIKSIFGKDFQRKLALHRNGGGGTILHFALQAKYFLEIVWPFVDDVLTDDDLKEVLNFNNFMQQNMLFEALMREDKDTAKDFILKLKHRLSTEDFCFILLSKDSGGLSLMHNITISKNIDFLCTWKVLEECLSREELKTLCKEVSSGNQQGLHIGENILYIAMLSGNTNAVLDLWTKLCELFGESTACQFLVYKNSLGMNILTEKKFIYYHEEFSYFYLLYTAKVYLNSEDFMQLLMTQDGQNNSLALLMAQFANASFIETFWSQIRDLPIEFIKNLFYCTNIKGENIFHRFSYRKSAQAELEMLAFWKMIREVFNFEQIGKLSIAKNVDGDDPFICNEDKSEEFVRIFKDFILKNIN